MGRQWLHAKRLVAGLKKGRTTGKLVREISVAAKMGGPDPSMNARLFTAVEKAKKESAANRIPDAPLTHPLSDYAGEFEHPGYGTFTIVLDGDSLKGSTKTQGDFNLAHRFTIEIDGVAIGGVHTIEGLEHEHEVVEYHDGDEGVTRFRPGRQKQGRIKIHRDFSATKEFFN